MAHELQKFAAECLGKSITLKDGVAGAVLVKRGAVSLAMVSKNGSVNVYGTADSREEMGKAKGATARSGWVCFPSVASFIAHASACKWLKAADSRPAPPVKKPKAKKPKADKPKAKKPKAKKPKAKTARA
jgi:hypothetical protein